MVQISNYFQCVIPDNNDNNFLFVIRRLFQFYCTLFINLLHSTKLSMNFLTISIGTIFWNYLQFTEALQTDIVNALIMESLKNNMVQACDGEKVALHCPRNTHINLVNTFYGRLVPSFEFCPSPSMSTNMTTDIIGEDTSCHIPNAHSKIQQHCRNKRNCRFTVKASFFDEDFCPTTSKYLQISYKCKPILFDDQSFCEGSAMQVSCKENRRLAIHSAQYGRTINGQALHCTPFTPVERDCVVDVMDRILPRCYAKNSCALSVNDHYFPNACPNGVQKYLTLIYMCVNEDIYTEAALNGKLEAMKKLPKESFMNSAEEMPNDDSRNYHSPPNRGSLWDEDYEVYPGKSHPEKHYTKSPKTVDFIGDIKTEEATEDSGNAVAALYSFKTVIDYIKANKEKAFLYAALGLSIGLTLLLSACVVIQCLGKKKLAKKQAATATAPSSTTEYDSLLCEKTQTSPSFSICVNPESHACFDMGDLTHNGKSFMRFSQLTPPRVPQNLHCYS